LAQVFSEFHNVAIHSDFSTFIKNISLEAKFPKEGCFAQMLLYLN